MFSGLEFFLYFIVLVAAGCSFWYGHNTGLNSGVEYTVDLMVEEGLVSRYITDDGNMDICSAGIMNNICPKCGFHEGDNCDEHS